MPIEANLCILFRCAFKHSTLELLISLFLPRSISSIVSKGVSRTGDFLNLHVVARGTEEARRREYPAPRFLGLANRSKRSL